LSAPVNLLWTTGIEWLYNEATVQDNGNKNGEPDTLQFRDHLAATQWFAFTQAGLKIKDHWELNAGISWNHQGYHYQRVSEPATAAQEKKTTPVFTPRISVGYRVNNDFTLYALASKGFSPPSLAEIRPSDGNYYGDLQAEYGWNFEAGLKGYACRRRLKFDATAYFFRLQHAIVRRVTAIGAEYFVNAGSTRQNGLEMMLNYQLITSKKNWVQSWQVWSSYSYQPFYFVQYQQAGTDYSGNALTGVPQHNWVSGTDLNFVHDWQAHLSLNCTSRIPLNDVNTFWAANNQLLQASIGHTIKAAGHPLECTIGADNLFNQLYSLGNDLNAAGNRFYNPAPPRNYYCSVRLRF
ncbi:MAG TPA: TonB-dependent receptor, partial [Sediminibacterium sp.]|nr:TonB-dependent receptor [Sediminibacterium sp.]